MSYLTASEYCLRSLLLNGILGLRPWFCFRLTHSQHEVMSLKQQVESLRSASLNATSAESHEHLSTVINSLRSDSDRVQQLYHFFLLVFFNGTVLTPIKIFLFRLVDTILILISVRVAIWVSGTNKRSEICGTLHTRVTGDIKHGIRELLGVSFSLSQNLELEI